MSRCLHFSQMAALIATASLSSGQIRYSLKDLGTLGGTSSTAYAVNASGVVVGEARIATRDRLHAFVYSHGVMKDLGALGGRSSAAYGINDAGEVVGRYDPERASDGLPLLCSFEPAAAGPFVGLAKLGAAPQTGGIYRAFRYAAGAMSDLGPLCRIDSEAFAINRAGQIAGIYFVDTDHPSGAEPHAFLYSAKGNAGLVPLGSLSGLPAAADAWLQTATGINDSGEVVGGAAFVVAGRNVYHAFLYAAGQATDLGTLGGGYSEAAGINAAGEIVGAADVAALEGDFARPLPLHAFLYAHGKMTDLGTLGEKNLSRAYGINASGHVVGSVSTIVGGPSTAVELPVCGFLYSGGKMVDVNSLLDSSGAGWHVEDARAINDRGQIAANARNRKTGQVHAVLLTPF